MLTFNAKCAFRIIILKLIRTGKCIKPTLHHQGTCL